jgi:multicomponent Na+:H+ antiporter subunit G
MEVVKVALVGVGVLSVLVSCLGLATARDTYDRLHYLSAAGTLGPVLIATGILLEAGLDGLKAVLVAAILVITGPVLTHAIGRAARLAEQDRKERR